LVSPHETTSTARRLVVVFIHELRRLLSGRAFWALLLILAPLAGYG